MQKRKHRFRIILPALVLVIAGVIPVLYTFNYIPHAKYSNAHFGIETYISENDADGDGIDDQTDILQSTRAYIATLPKYKSRYYDGGYPDDGYGVCTDVVAFSLLGAGYDLRQLVDEDIRSHPDDYAVDEADSNIDFRRVRNLKVWFNRNAENLTTDLSDIAAWQGGDIVIFDDHIGIVSDKRNARGIPFLIHHANPYQASYEEDVLAFRQDLAGHYRMP